MAETLKDFVKTHRNTLIYAILLVLSYFIFLGLEQSRWFIEHAYGNGIYPILSGLLRTISGFIPFSMGDLLYVSLIGYGFYKLVKLIVNRKKLTKDQAFLIPLKLINTFLLAIMLFKLFWGFNYYRQSVSIRLGISQQTYSVAELRKLTELFVLKTNKAREKANFTAYSDFNILRKRAVKAYREQALTHSFFSYKPDSFKPVISSWLTSTFGIEGYYNPFTGEANMNTILPKFNLPFVACHEISHQLGVAKEDEANLIGYLAAAKSKDPDFQYSAYYNMLRYLLLELRLKSTADYDKIFAKLSPGIIEDFKSESNFWRKYNSNMSGYMSVAFDRFLKLNQQTQGIKSYQNIVIWLWNLHKHELKDDQHSIN